MCLIIFSILWSHTKNVFVAKKDKIFTNETDNSDEKSQNHAIARKYRNVNHFTIDCGKLFRLELGKHI